MKLYFSGYVRMFFFRTYPKMRVYPTPRAIMSDYGTRFYAWPDSLLAGF